MPNTYQSTTSVSSIGRFRAVHAGSPSSRLLWLTNSPHGHRSSGAYGVTHRVCPMTCARWNTGEAGSIIGGKQPPGTSLYATGWPSLFSRPGFAITQLRCRSQL